LRFRFTSDGTTSGVIEVIRGHCRSSSQGDAVTLVWSAGVTFKLL
jgi:hypothetical protein